jgi:hypothetical protein
MKTWVKNNLIYTIPFVLGLGLSYLAHELIDLNNFKSKGARYTYDDGVHDRAERDKRDAELQAQIDELRTKCLESHITF